MVVEDVLRGNIPASHLADGRMPDGLMLDDVEAYMNKYYGLEKDAPRSLPMRTSTTLEAVPRAAITEHTKARVRIESPGPLETAAKAGKDELRKYLYGV